jgi:hypothetical protein
MFEGSVTKHCNRGIECETSTPTLLPVNIELNQKQRPVKISSLNMTIAVFSNILHDKEEKNTIYIPIKSIVRI